MRRVLAGSAGGLGDNLLELVGLWPTLKDTSCFGPEPLPALAVVLLQGAFLGSLLLPVFALQCFRIHPPGRSLPPGSVADFGVRRSSRAG
jgi:hypothetical protein